MVAMFSCLFVQTRILQMSNALMIVDHIVIKISYGAVNTIILKQQKITLLYTGSWEIYNRT